MDHQAEYSDLDIAVVGLSCRLPGAASASEYWDNIRSGVESVRDLSEAELLDAGVPQALLDDPHYIRRAPDFEGAQWFDAGFFGLNPKEADVMDPQHRLFLECGWHALEDGGYDPSRYSGSIGVFGGSGYNAYLAHNLLTNPELVASMGFFLLRHTGNDKDFLTTRLSYQFGLTGPSVNVQTACSTSLVAIHMACQSLLSGECDMALAGGSTIELPLNHGYLYKPDEIYAADGHCRPFDDTGDGTLFGSGCGMVLLKPASAALEDGDPIRAIIRATAINNDGAAKAGYLAPGVEGQAKVVSEALKLAEIDARSIGYVEAHGTGTRVGDPIEFAALNQVYQAQTQDLQFCGIGSVKGNIGHTDTAAGVAGLIKCILAMEAEELPPTINYTRPNRQIDFANSAFYVNDALRPWPVSDRWPRRSAVSSLGVGGTNAHIVLEEAPRRRAQAPLALATPSLLLLSARNETALQAASDNLVTYLQSHPDANLQEVAFTLQQGRHAFSHRQALLVRTAAEAIERLDGEPDSYKLQAVTDDVQRSVAFMFTGQGSQYQDMGKGLYCTEPRYRQVFDECADALQRISGEDIRDSIGYRDGGSGTTDINATSLTQPTLFCLEYSLAQLWMSRGVVPTAMIGHSFGEYVAAALAGVFNLEDALALVKERGRLMQQAPAGAMLSVMLSAKEVSRYVSDDVEVAAYNGPNVCVVSGTELLIDEFQDRLTRDEIGFTRLKISLAGHSKAMDSILDEFRTIVARAKPQAPTRPFISNVTGTWITPEQCQDPDYWASHLRRPVQFATGIETLIREQPSVLLEIGPGTTLTQLANLCLASDSSSLVTHSLGGHQCDLADEDCFARAHAALWLGGIGLSWEKLYAEQPRRLSLPGYSFTRQRHWIEPGFRLGEAVPEALASAPASTAALHQTIRSWQPANAPEQAGSAGTVVLFGARPEDSFADDLRVLGHQVVVTQPGTTYEQRSQHLYLLDPDSREQHEQLFADIAAQGDQALRIVFLDQSAVQSSSSEVPGTAFWHAVTMLAALAASGQEATELTVVSHALWPAVGDDRIEPERALLLGPALIAPLEVPGLQTQVVDVGSPDDMALAIPLIGSLAAHADPIRSARLLACRAGQLLEAGYEPLPIPGDAPDLALSAKKTYLLVGGAEGIGSRLAQALADRGARRIAFLGRTPLPPRAQWADWQDANIDDGVSRRLTLISKLRGQGVEVEYRAADISDAQATAQAIGSVTEALGPIHGAYHLAGIVDDGLLPGKTASAVARVLAPKVAGTRNLAQALEQYAPNLEFLVLFSSVSAAAGVPGQVDYVAANAFQDHYAQAFQRRTGIRTLAIAWSAWSDIGIAARLANGNRASPAQLHHPLIARQLEADPGNLVFEAVIDPAQHWVVNDHRLSSGEAVLPGTGFLELTRAAWKGLPGPQALRISNALFLAPLVFRDSAPRTLNVQFEPAGNATRFSVISRDGDDGDWFALFQGRLDAAPEMSEVSPALPALRERCATPVPFEDEQAEHLRFGDRWTVIQDIRAGEQEALLSLALPDNLADDVNSWNTHPGLLDMATAGYLRLIPGYNSGDGFYVPVSCRALTLYEGLPARCISHLRFRAEDSVAGDLAVFDITIMAEDGRVLATFSEYMLKRLPSNKVIADATPQLSTKARALGREPATAGGNALMQERLAATGISPSDGLEALFQLQQQAEPSAVIVSGADIETTLASLQGPDGRAHTGRRAPEPQIDVVPAELALRGHEAIVRCALVTKVDRFGDLRVAAFVEQDDDLATTVSEIRRFARKHLPGELVPSTIIEVTEFPVDEQGNVLKAELPDPFEADEAYVEANSSSERMLAEVWKDVLGIDHVSITDNFFDLGGHSLLAVRVLSDINKQSGVRLEDVLIVTSTLEQIAAELDRRLTPEATAANDDDGKKSGGLLDRLGLRGRRG
jgi:acyl transferase domain-containing protein